ncbi:MAG: energy-coupling factor transporter transmembrane protein EcfT [Chloroflexi bacterium]|nr:energy-coupling factor transporter transmembrane protein EcfT [Chloroflexota bacterium]
MSAIFSMYVARESGLHGLHPLTKLTLTFCLFTASFALPWPWVPYALTAIVVLPLAVWGRVAVPFLRGARNLVLPFAVSVFLIQGLFWGGGTQLVALGPLSVKLEGLVFAAVSTGRILMIASVFLLFAMTTRPDLLMITLKQVGFPGGIAYIIVTTIQIVPRFQAKANAILDAQRSRGLETEGNFLVRARALLPLVMPLVLGSLVEVEERAIAVEARAFNSKRRETSLIEIADSLSQKIGRWLMIGITSGLVITRVIWR